MRTCHCPVWQTWRLDVEGFNCSHIFGPAAWSVDKQLAQRTWQRLQHLQQPHGLNTEGATRLGATDGLGCGGLGCGGGGCVVVVGQDSRKASRSRCSVLLARLRHGRCHKQWRLEQL